MRNRRKTKINKSKFIPFIAFLISSIILIFMLFQFINQKKMINEYKNNTSILKNQSNELKEEIENLTKQIEEVNSLEYIEKKAREDLGMIKKDEKIYVDEIESSKENQEESSDESKEEVENNNQN